MDATPTAESRIAAEAAGEEPRLIVTIEPPKGWLRLSWRELWQYRDLGRMLALRGIQIRYKQALLGGLWAILQPTITAALFTVFFARFLNVKVDGLPPMLFYYAGLLPWTLFAATVTGSASSMVENQQLLTKVYFPRLWIPLSVTGYTVLDMLLSSIILIGLMAWFGQAPAVWAVAAPLILAFCLATAVGLGTLLAALTVKYRDFRFVVPFLVQVMLFATPVIYSLTSVPAPHRWVLSLNPMTGVVTAFRAALFGTPMDLGHLAISCSVGVILLVVGLAYFRQAEDQFADIV